MAVTTVNPNLALGVRTYKLLSKQLLPKYWLPNFFGGPSRFEERANGHLVRRHAGHRITDNGAWAAPYIPKTVLNHPNTP